MWICLQYLVHDWTWDKRTHVVIIKDYKTVRKFRDSFSVMSYYSVTSFHMKKQCTFLLKIKWLKNETWIEKASHGFFPDLGFLSDNKKF